MQGESQSHAYYRAIIFSSKVVNLSGERREGRLNWVFSAEHAPWQVQLDHQVSYAWTTYHIWTIQMGSNTCCFMESLVTFLVLGMDKTCAPLLWGALEESFPISGGVRLALLLQSRYSCFACLLRELVSYHQCSLHHVQENVHFPIGDAYTW